MRRLAALVVIACCGIHMPAQASWLSKITGIHINPSKGEFRVEAPQPDAIPEMLQNLPRDAAQFVLNPAGAALSEAIRWSHNQNIGSAEPIPPSIRGRLSQFFPPQVLDSARYRIKSHGISLPVLINKVQSGTAVTLDDLIVFPDDAAVNDIELWAHELTHVVQYRNMGVESFANVYSLTGGYQLEQQARENAGQVLSALNNGGPQGGYELASTAFSQPTPQQAFIEAAKTFVPPANCVTWGPIMGGAVVQNQCQVPVVITSFGVAGPYGPMPVACISACIIPPMGGGPYYGAPALVIGLTFAFM